MKVIAFSLWGDTPKYVVGAFRNAQLAPHLYPGWEVRFYVHRDVAPAVRAALETHGARLITVDDPAGWRGLFWRYRAIADEDVEVALFRDSDSRLSLREAAAVGEWLACGRTLHVMRDHPAHRHPIMGGLWGVRCREARWIGAHATGATGDYWQADQEYLAAAVWPRLCVIAWSTTSSSGAADFPYRGSATSSSGRSTTNTTWPAFNTSEACTALHKRPFETNRRLAV
jgi:hypothetical protein